MAEEYSDEEQEETLNEVYKWGREFSQSKHFETLTQEEKDESESVVMFFAEYMYSYIGVRPEEWDRSSLEECCLDVLPRKITADLPFFRAIAPVLSAFFTFARERGLLRKGLRLADAVRGIAGEIVANAADSRNWGMAKSFCMAAHAAGVDITNEAELQQYIASCNRRIAPTLQQESRCAGLARNDPCPCGSGRKFKNCCGRKR